MAQSQLTKSVRCPTESNKVSLSNKPEKEPIRTNQANHNLKSSLIHSSVSILKKL